MVTEFMVNSRLTVAIHILGLLAYETGHPVTSEYIAGSVNTNPVVIRRLLGVLRKAGFVRSQGGAAGGWELVKSPEALTLLDVYMEVEPGSVFAFHKNAPNPLCPIGRGVQRGIAGYYQRAQGALEKELSKVTIAQVLRDTLAEAGGLLSCPDTKKPMGHLRGLSR